jgi:tripartite-type tricarboxylate transporter receptor subunit TctC
MRRRPFTFTLSFLAALVLGAALPFAQAQEKPPLCIVVDFPPGGSADILMYPYSRSRA